MEKQEIGQEVESNGPCSKLPIGMGTRGQALSPEHESDARDSRVSTQAAPAGKPINFYDESWYAKLPEGKRKELEAKQPVEFLTSLDD